MVFMFDFMPFIALLLPIRLALPMFVGMALVGIVLGVEVVVGVLAFDVFITVVFILLAFEALLAVGAPPHAIPKPVKAKTVESAITFLIILLIFLKD